MSWKDDNALKRIFSTFKRLKSNIFQQDIDALKQLQESLEFYKKQNVDRSKVYAVILCMLIKERTRRMDINTALYMIGQDCKHGLDFHIGTLTSQLICNDLNSFMKESKIDVPTQEKNPEELQKYIEQWHEKYDKDFLDRILNSWTDEEVSRQFYNT